MKKNKKAAGDLQFARERLGAAPALPESLAPEAVAARVAHGRQKAPVKKLARRWAAVAVAACLLLGITTVWRWSVFAPNITADAASYREVGALLRDYRRSRIGKEFISNVTGVFDFSLRTKDAPMAFPSADGDAMSDGFPNTAGNYGEDAAAAEGYSDFTAKSSDVCESTATSYHAQTNTREAGVYEEDVIQTDGDYLYILANGGSFRVIDIRGGGMALAGSLELRETDDAWKESYTGFYLYGKKIIFVGTTARYSEEEGAQRSAEIRVYDFSDIAAPKKERALSFDGEAAASRVTDGKMILVTSFYPYESKIDYDDYTTFIPACRENGAVSYQSEDGLYFGATDEAEVFTTVSTFRLDDPASPVERCSVFGGAADVYCTTRSLYVYRGHWEENRNVTSLIRFDLSGEKPAFAAKGEIPGYLLNGFSLDEYNGYLRAASTIDDEDGNRVYALDGGLRVIGTSEPLAPGEQIRSVRFMGDTAYVVTFYQTDPLFVLDLSDPAAPTLKGELKLPGFSAYLHPAGAGLLLGVGSGGTENGLDGSAKLSLFDVADPAAPREISTLTIEDGWFETDYKAFLSMGDGSFLIGYERWFDESATTADGEEYGYGAENGALRVAVRNGELVQLAAYSPHEKPGDMLRASFAGDAVYLVDGIRYPFAGDGALRLYAFDRETAAETGSLTVDVPYGIGDVICY